LQGRRKGTDDACAGEEDRRDAMEEVPKVLEKMQMMWNERDLEQIRDQIDEIFSASVVFIDPANSIVGHDAFEKMVRAFRTRWPDADLSHASGFDGHHDLYRYHWKIHQESKLLMEGFDVTELDPDGRVSRVLGFFGPIPSD
jgi:hypothetical protein